MLIVVIPLYVVLQVVVLRYVRGLWRWFAALPLIWMLPVFVLTVNEYRQQSELWLLMPILTSPIASIWLLIIAALFYVINRRRNQSPS